MLNTRQEVLDKITEINQKKRDLNFQHAQVATFLLAFATELAGLYTLLASFKDIEVQK